MRRFLTILSATALVLTYSGAAIAGDDGDEGLAQFRPRPVSNSLPHFGVGVKVGTLGIGVQIGTALASRVNLRGGANFFNYNDSLTENGVTYTGTLQLRSVETKLDLFLIGGFRLTPGLVLYNDNKVSATASVPTGTSVSFGGTRYFSNPNDPLRGTAAISFNKFAPSLGIGFGNLLPRGNRHWSLSTDLGIVFGGAPAFALGFAGSACSQNNTTSCQPAVTPSVSASVEAERAKIQSDLNSFKYYPEASIMFGWKF
jgi:hypothetical protein